MKKSIIIILIIILAVSFSILFRQNRQVSRVNVNNDQGTSLPVQVPKDNSNKNKNDAVANNSNKNNNGINANINNNSNQNSGAFGSPLSDAKARVTKKTFGLFVTPQNSPIQPERFSGYHTGTDFETYPSEQNSDVSISAVCSGKMLEKKYASGYGGVMVQSCKLNQQDITVVYGHLKLASITKNVGDAIQKGDNLGVLGKGYSSETDGERKHLHLGFHKGTGINILGYVQNKADLSGWLDPCEYVCF